MREARCYQNSGNPFIFDFLGPEDRRILDVGCGSGDNAALILSRYPDARVCGITVSEREKKLASGIMESCWLADVETGEPDFLGDLRFDRLLFCHVLEHFKDPGSVLEKFIPYLKPGGKILILVPNAAFWKQRMKFLFGDIAYEDEGIMDRTHVRLFTFRNLEDVLSLSSIPRLKPVRKKADGSAPLWKLRRLLPSGFRRTADRAATDLWPNLFGYQIALECFLAETP